MKINMEVINYGKCNETTRLMISQNFWKFQKYENFREKFEKIEFLNFKEEKLRTIWDVEALYESSVRKLG